MQKIQEHFLQDIYRLKEGTILEINKFERVGYMPSGNHKKRKLKGISKAYQTLETTTMNGGKVFPAGSYVVGAMLVEPITDTKDYRIELKSSGGTIFGNMELHRKLYKEIESIFSSYGEKKG